MLEGKAKLLKVREIEGKRGKFKVARFGDVTECSQSEVYVDDVVKITEMSLGKEFNIKLVLGQNGYKLTGTLKGIVA